MIKINLFLMMLNRIKALGARCGSKSIPHRAKLPVKVRHANRSLSAKRRDLDRKLAGDTFQYEV